MPNTVSMIERLMHDIHFAVDPNSSFKKQALKVIHKLQKHYPIKWSPMRLRLNVSEQNSCSLLEKLNSWNATTVSKDKLGSHPSIIRELDPGFFCDWDALVRSLQGRLEILAVSLHFEGDAPDDDYEEPPQSLPKSSTDLIVQLGKKIHRQTLSEEKGAEPEVKENKRSACTFVGDAKQYRDHFKSEWHKHNLKRKTRNLPPLKAEECSADLDLMDSKADLKDYSF